MNNPAIQPTDSVPPHPTLADYYGSAAERENFVRGLFDETAPWYEKINVLLSFGSGGWYRRDALRRAGYEKGTKLLDIATGTWRGQGPLTTHNSQLRTGRTGRWGSSRTQVMKHT